MLPGCMFIIMHTQAKPGDLPPTRHALPQDTNAGHCQKIPARRLVTAAPIVGRVHAGKSRQREERDLGTSRMELGLDCLSASLILRFLVSFYP